MKEGFEETLTWTLKNNKNPSAVTAVGVTNTDAHSGTYAYIVTTTDYAEVELYKEFVIPTDGRTVRFSAWVKAESSSNQGALVYTYYAGDKDRKSNEVKSSGDNWEKVEVVIRPEATAGTKIRFSLGWYGTGTVYWDDVCASYDLGEDVALGIPEAEGQNLFTNGSMESGGKNWKIEASETSFAGGGFTDEVSHSGTHSAQLYAYSGKNAYVYQTLSRTLEVGAEYELRLWILRMTENTSAQIKLQHRGTASNTTVLWPEGNLGAWTECSFRFIAPVGELETDFLFRAYDSSMIYYDDLSLRKVSDPTRFYFVTDEIFYYTDMTVGDATLTVNQTAFPQYAGYTAQISIYDSDDHIIHTGEAKSLAAGSTTIKFPLTGMTDPNMTYTAVCTLRDDGVVVETKELELFRSFARPSNLGEDGTILVNGKPFSPVFGYHVSENQLELAKSLGINVVQISYDYAARPEDLVAYLDKLEKNDMYGLVCLYGNMKPAAAEENRQNSENAVKAVRDHAAVFAYCVMDEPVGNACDEAELLESYRLVRSLDAVHPVFAVDMQPSYTPKLSQWVDIMGMDHYPYGSAKSVYWTADGVKEGLKFTASSKKPVTTLLQFFFYNNYFPTENELRNMLYQSFFAGASGIGYFAVNESVGGVQVAETPAGQMVKEFAKEEQGILFDLFVHDKGQKADEGETDTVQWARFMMNGRTYIAVRSKKVDAEVSVTLEAGRSDGVLRSIGEVKEATFNGDTLSVKLPMAGAALLEIRDPYIVLHDGEKEVEVLTPGDMIYATCKGMEGMQVMMALYIQTNVGTELVKLAIEKGGEPVSIMVPEDGNVYCLQAFAWNPGGMEPRTRTSVLAGA